MALKKYQTLNAFDFSNPIIANGYIPSGSISFIAYASNGCVCVPIDSGVKYTISGIIRYSESVVIRYGTSNAVPTSNTTLIRVGSFEQGETAEITAQSGENYLLIMFCGDSDYNAYGSVQSAYSANCANLHVDYSGWNDIPYRRYETATDALTTLPVEIFTDSQPVSSYTLKGNTTTSGTPSPSNPITINGVGNKTANLLSYPDFTINGNISNYSVELYNDTLPAGQYTLSVYQNDTLTSSVRNTLRVYANNTVYYENTSENYHNQIGLHTLTFTINEDSAARLEMWGHTLSNDCTYTNVMLNTGSTALPYEPYGMYKLSISSNQTALSPVYLTEQLMKIDTYSDSVVSSGTDTRNVYKLVLNGTENWNFSSGSYYLEELINYLRGVGENYAICSHFPTSAQVEKAVDVPNGYVSFTYGVNKRLYFKVASTITSLADFKQFLADQYAAGTPVTVYYVLATPTTETVTAPSIPTTGGTATIDVDTTVKPSELDLTYHGWHEHQPLKRENGQWS